MYLDYVYTSLLINHSMNIIILLCIQITEKIPTEKNSPKKKAHETKNKKNNVQIIRSMVSNQFLSPHITLKMFSYTQS